MGWGIWDWYEIKGCENRWEEWWLEKLGEL